MGRSSPMELGADAMTVILGRSCQNTVPSRLGFRWAYPVRDCLAPRRWARGMTYGQTPLPHPTHTDEYGGGCPVVSQGDATSSAQTTGHSRPRRLLSMPAIHEKSNNMHPDLHRGGDPVPGNIRDCLATRRWVATNNVEQTRLPHTTHTHEDGGGCPVVREGDATSSAQTTGHSCPRRTPWRPVPCR